jgi:hypothetical protein
MTGVIGIAQQANVFKCDTPLSAALGGVMRFLATSASALSSKALSCSFFGFGLSHPESSR